VGGVAACAFGGEVMDKTNPRQVWWFDGMGEEAHHARIAMHMDLGGDNLNNLGDTSSLLRQGRLFPRALDARDYLFVKSKTPVDVAKIPDLSMMANAFLISGAMVDFLTQGGFDLTDTDIIELPLYDGAEGFHLGRSPGDPLVPGRWAVLHIRAVKRALMREHSVGRFSEYSITTRQKTTKLVVSEAALEGPDLWVDFTRRQNPFLSQRLRDALLATDLRVTGIDWLRPAEVFDPTI